MKNENAELIGGVTVLLAAAAAVSYFGSSLEGSPELQEQRRKRRKRAREALQSQARKAQEDRRPANLAEELEEILGMSSGPTGDKLVKAIESGTNAGNRALLRDWVRSGRRLDPLQAARIRARFLFPQGEVNDLLEAACTQ